MSSNANLAGRVEPAVLLTRAVRLVALSLLLVSYAAYLLQEFPISSTQEDLLKALRSDTPPVVEVGYDDHGVTLIWETAPLVYRQLRAQAPGQLGDAEVTAVEEMIAARAGAHVEDLPFRDRRTDREIGGLAVLLPASYPLFLRATLLKWSVVGVGVAVLIAAYALPRRLQRVKNRGVWFAVCLTTGFGFFTFLCVERCESPHAGAPTSELKPRYVWTLSLATGALLVLAGWGLVRGMSGMM